MLRKGEESLIIIGWTIRIIGVTITNSLTALEEWEYQQSPEESNQSICCYLGAYI